MSNSKNIERKLNRAIAAKWPDNITTPLLRQHAKAKTTEEKEIWEKNTPGVEKSKGTFKI